MKASLSAPGSAMSQVIMGVYAPSLCVSFVRSLINVSQAVKLIALAPIVPNESFAPS